MIKVALFDENNTHFATFDMPELPRKGDTIEIGFAGEQTVKSFTVERVVHQMIHIPVGEYTVDNPSTYWATYKSDAPWRWEHRLHGYLDDPEKKYVCICAPNQGAVDCPKHGVQDANRELCPECGKAVLGYCAQGEYCTSESCRYVA